jgi:hypothetical protein
LISDTEDEGSSNEDNDLNREARLEEARIEYNEYMYKEAEEREKRYFESLNGENEEESAEEAIWEQRHDAIHENDCSDGEGCNKSECDLTHRDASGNDTRYL